MNLQITQKLSDKLKRTLIDVDSLSHNDIDVFHCNLLKFGRYNCVLITNNKTLYSFFLFGLKADDFKHFEEVVRERVFKLLIESGLAQSQFEKILESMEIINYSKTSNRSVVASMNDMKRQIESYLEIGNDIYEVNRKLNKTPYKAIGYKYPVKLFSEMLKS
ncbi:DUF6933 domain-containing protein [Sulfurimonas hongkongensis]|uniref:DUF6933 domain-containing protein n=1 Tax=Sulfurimonas hongkongensis TaxID=1172190 RepID=UPI00040A6969|nr:hypothetical protein [Sulfurimonas hongkongensis]